MKNGFVSTLGYSEDCDWLFIPSETTEDERLSIGDYYWQNSNNEAGYLAPLVGCGAWVNRIKHRDVFVGGRPYCG